VRDEWSANAAELHRERIDEAARRLGLVTRIRVELEPGNTGLEDAGEES
jgi:hypothetical protein